MHDFAITQKHVVLLDSSLVVAPQASALLCMQQCTWQQRLCSLLVHLLTGHAD